MKKKKAPAKVAVTLRGDHLDFIKEVANAALVTPNEVVAVMLAMELLSFRARKVANAEARKS